MDNEAKPTGTYSARDLRRKRRTANQRRGDTGERLIAHLLPDEWVVRDIRPDYGLDLHIEIFDLLPDGSGTAQTLAEHIFAQVKTTSLPVVNRTVSARGNVAKGPLSHRNDDTMDIGVVLCKIDVVNLVTIESMGPAVPVVLFAVDDSTKLVYYVCLSDYITKVLRPENPNFEEQESVTIRIPAWNVLDVEDPSFGFIRLLGRRAKLYAAFNIFNYQHVEFRRRTESGKQSFILLNDDTVLLASDLRRMLSTFVESDLRLDIWEPTGDAFWSPLFDVKANFQQVRELLTNAAAPIPAAEFDAMQHAVQVALHRASNLGSMYEELVREWRLPTLLAVHMDDAPHLRHRPPATA